MYPQLDNEYRLNEINKTKKTTLWLKLAKEKQ